MLHWFQQLFQFSLPALLLLAQVHHVVLRFADLLIARFDAFPDFAEVIFLRLQLIIMQLFEVLDSVSQHVLQLL